MFYDSKGINEPILIVVAQMNPQGKLAGGGDELIISPFRADVGERLTVGGELVHYYPRSPVSQLDRDDRVDFVVIVEVCVDHLEGKEKDAEAEYEPA